MRNFMELLRGRWGKGLSVCVGLDSDYDELPPSIKREWSETKGAVFLFNREIVDATASLACAFKPNFAFYFGHGLEGVNALAKTIRYIHERYPEIPVILDAKVGDIGNTNNLYVKALLTAFMQADAITVHNYLGQTAMQPFLDQKDKGVIVLCRTSNPGSDEFQNLTVETDLSETGSMPLYQYVARQVSEVWDRHGNCGLVAGATYPENLAVIRNIVGDSFPLLIPGIGKQGGDVNLAVAAGSDRNGQGMIINSSSGIIFASKGEDYAEAARRETEKLHRQIRAALTEEGFR